MTALSVKPTDFADTIKSHAEKYPLMMPIDAIKLAFQASFGTGHLLKDRETALCRIIDEEALVKKSAADAKSNQSVSSTVYEEIGGGFARVYLGKGVPSELLCRMFSSAAHECDAASEKQFLRYLDIIKKCAENGIFSFNACELSEHLKSYLSGGVRPVSHSERYRAAYSPAYRVVPLELAVLLPLLTVITEKTETGSLILAIDGSSASGKSTLAEKLSSLFSARLIHMDDYFLPPEKRTPERLSECGGNVDYERFNEEVILHLYDESLTCGIFDCSVMSVTHSITHKKTPLTIIEGAYSCHPYFGDYADCKIFIETSEEEQILRIIERNGPEMCEKFKNVWIPAEKKYAETFMIREKSDYIITT